MKFNIENTREFCAGGDTDSCFFKAGPQLEKRLGKDYKLLDKKTIINEIKQIAEDNSNKINNKLHEITKRLFNVNKNRIEFKTETIIQSAYWAGKRRYAQYIVNKEGNDVEEFDIKGLDLMKSNFPLHFRTFGEQIIKDILFSVPKQDIDKKIMDFKKSLNTIDWKHLLKPTGLKKLDEYIESYPRPGEIFSKFKSRTPINTRASVVSNDLLRYHNLTVKYPEFNLGDKIYIAYLKNNPLKLSVVGLNGYNDAPVITEMVDKYIDREGVFDSVFKNKLESLYSDLSWDLVLNENIHKFFNIS